MSLWKRGDRYWTDFAVEGRRYRKPLRTSKLQEAKRLERDLIEAARSGSVSQDESGPKTLAPAIVAYLSAKKVRCSPRTLELEEERLSIVKRHFGDVKLSAITVTAIAEFQRIRHEAGIANRTINMDIGVLSRVLKSCGRWRSLADHVKPLPERQRVVGRALTPEEQRRLFEAAAKNPDWEHVYCAAVVAANTSMRPVEVKHLRRADVDLRKKIVVIRRSKNQSSHRIIPLNASALKALGRMVERLDQLGFMEHYHYLWHACQWGKLDPTKSLRKWDTAWRALRDEAGLPGLRFHDLRHTVITELAEMGVADHVMESITGHLSRKMLEHYSHIRIDAKRQALDALDAMHAEEQAARPGVVEAVAEPLPIAVGAATSQTTSRSVWLGSVDRGKLLIPLPRRDVRVVEGARLEIAWASFDGMLLITTTVYE